MRLYFLYVQIFIVLSSEQVAKNFPFLEKHTFQTISVCSFKTCISYPVLLSQILAVLSQELDAIYLSSGEKVTLVTTYVCAYCLFNTFFPFFKFQTFIVSLPDDTRSYASEEK